MPEPDKVDPERQRIAAALIALVGESGYEGLSAETIAKRAGVAMAVFKRHFADEQDCLDQVWAEMTKQVIDLVKGAFAAEESWRDSLRAAAYAALGFIQADEVRARFFLVEVLAGGELVQARRDLMMEEFVDLIDAGHEELDDPDSVPRAKAEAVTGAIYENMITTLQRKAGIEAGPQLLREMMYLAVLSYLGPGAAQEELRRGPEDGARHGRGAL